jgi:hypothetical protein
MPKAKPVSLHPLSFDDALKALIRVDPNRVSPKRRKSTSKPKPPKRQAHEG